jgi:hypothetical protein
MGSSQCFSDQRFAICCLRRGDGNVRASLLIKNPAALVPCVVCDPCAMLVCRSINSVVFKRHRRCARVINQSIRDCLPDALVI